MTEQQKVGVIVVHGVGDHKPGEVLDDFTDTMIQGAKEANLALTFEPIERHRLPDIEKADAKRYKFFHMMLRRGKLPNYKLVCAEVFWGSASQLPTGWLGVLQGLFKLYMRVNVVIDAARPKNPDFGQRVYFGLAKAIWFLIVGPLLAINIALLVGLGFYWMGLLCTRGSTSAGLDCSISFAGFHSAVIVMVLIGAALWFIKVFRVTGTSLMVVAPAWLLITRITDSKTFGDLADSGIDGVRVFISLTYVCILILILSYLVYAWRLRNLPSLAPMTAALLVILVQFGLWVLLVPTLWSMLGSWIPSWDKIWIGMIQTDGTQWILAALLSIVLVIVWVHNWQWTRRHVKSNQDTRENALSAPRLIVSPAIGVTMGAIAMGSAIFAVLYRIRNFLGWNIADPIEDQLRWLSDLQLTQIIASSLPILIPALIVPLRLVLDLINDVFNYVDAVSLPQRAQLFVQQDDKVLPIRDRFCQVVEYLLKTEEIDRLVVLSHSQGTVIALDALAHLNYSPELHDKLHDITFVTMGSPITHLYQHYMPTCYPAWDDEIWNRFFGRVSRWLHFYRIDDFVGTQIKKPTERCSTSFQQFGIGSGGHNSYWLDKGFVCYLPQIFKDWVDSQGGSEHTKSHQEQLDRGQQAQTILGGFVSWFRRKPSA